MPSLHPMRLLPRFSLRFALLALTIFLIVFGVAVKYWRDYHEHEQIAERLQLQNYSIEEEPITLLGRNIGKRLTGLEIMRQHDAGYLELLEQLPRPQDMRRFGFRGEVFNQSSMVPLLTQIHRYSALQELHLQGLALTKEQAALLAEHPELRLLALSHGNLPQGSLKLAERLPRLETLILDNTVCDPHELLQLHLPELRYLDLSKSSLSTLDLTKQGWGRFPKLETLILRQNNLTRITTEPGALPRLKHLDLGTWGDEQQLDWPGITAALPELTLLAAPPLWLQPDSIPSIRGLANLRYFLVTADPPPRDDVFTFFISGGEPRPYGGVAQFRAVKPESVKDVFPARLVPALLELIQQRPDVLFSEYDLAVKQLLDPTGGANPYMWSTPNRRPDSGARRHAYAAPSAYGQQSAPAGSMPAYSATYGNTLTPSETPLPPATDPYAPNTAQDPSAKEAPMYNDPRK
jgi:hypothetical protein